MQSELITRKIEELTELARIEGDVNAQIVLLALSGARIIHADGIFAKDVQDIVRTKFKPAALQGLEDEKATKN